MDPEYILIVSDPDPVATAVAQRWGTPAATEWHVEGSPIRAVGSGVYLLRRPGWHIHDEHLDRLLPAELAARRPVLVFPSIHRSERGVAALTVHPLGNPGISHDVGGEPHRLNPTAPRLMTGALRSLAEGAKSLGVPATFEATHHGPSLDLPAFFAEIGFPEHEEPPADAVRILARALSDLTATVGDRVAVGVGGGHYAPHFTDLAVKRRWAFGHILSRHALAVADREIAESAYALTPGAEGILFARAEDAESSVCAGVARRLKDSEAESHLSPEAPP